MGRPRVSTLDFGQASKKFRDAGIPSRALIPIAPVDARIANVGDLDEKVLGKAPGRYNARSDDWRGLAGWYLRDGVPAETAKEMASWPTPNVGIMGLYAPAIDSDAENDAARLMIERVLVDAFGEDAGIAERLRGQGPRRLYAFKGVAINDPLRAVRTRHFSYALKDGSKHKLDIIGAGAQYLIAGTHQSGDQYRWAGGYDLCAFHEEKTLEKVENDDIERFVEAFKDELARKGGTLLAATGGRAPGEERDYSQEDPIFEEHALFDGLDRIENNEANFPTRDDFVVMLSAIRAALGSQAVHRAYDVQEWACADETWCPPEYFEKVWNSLDRGVRVERHTLDRIFRRNGVFESAKAEFPDDGKSVTAEVKEDKKERKKKQVGILERVASMFVFGDVNLRTDDSALTMRSAWNVNTSWKALDWWTFKSAHPDVGLILEIQEDERYNPKVDGFWNFIRDLQKYAPHVFFTAETKHPNFDRGEIVEEKQPDGSIERHLNMRFISPVIRFARKPPADPKQARRDTETYLEFVGRIFGDHADYELDTLAFMAQTGRRPGHLLFLVGDHGVGKSFFISSLISMFDGVGKGMGVQIDGTKVSNDSARRFALAKVEGARIISIKELPDKTSATSMAAVTASLKQIVDSGPDGDYFEIEKKGQDSTQVQNHAYVAISSNYEDAIKVEEQDRRIFYVKCGIDLGNQPGRPYYAAVLDVISKPERLAAVYRHLLGRNIEGYDVSAPPPCTDEKRAQMVASIADPLVRHMTAACEVLKRSSRRIFDMKEFASLMTAMAENEYNNTDGEIDDRRVYDFGFGVKGGRIQQLKRMARWATRLGTHLNADNGRLPTIYVMNEYHDQYKPIFDAGYWPSHDMMEREREAVPNLRQDHTWPTFAGPTKPSGRT